MTIVTVNYLRIPHALYKRINEPIYFVVGKAAKVAK